MLILSKLFIAGLSFSAALSFLLSGGRLFHMLKRFPIESKGRQQKLSEVGKVTAICSCCFLARCVMMCFDAFDKEADIRNIYNLETETNLDWICRNHSISECLAKLILHLNTRKARYMDTANLHWTIILMIGLKVIPSIAVFEAMVPLSEGLMLSDLNGLALQYEDDKAWLFRNLNNQINAEGVRIREASTLVTNCHHGVKSWSTRKLVEILPSSLVLYILRRIPSKLRLSQYHPLSSG